jgi:site-specific DNA-adenine methylase
MKKILAVLMSGILLVILGSVVFAADSTSSVTTGTVQTSIAKGAMTDEEKAQLETKKAELIAKYQTLSDEEKSLIKEMMQYLNPYDLLTDEEKTALKAKQDAAKAERDAELATKYQALSTELKALVDEIKAAYQADFSNLTDEEKTALKTKQETVAAKIKALSAEDRTAIDDFLPQMQNGHGHGDGPGRENGGNPGGKMPAAPSTTAITAS